MAGYEVFPDQRLVTTLSIALGLVDDFTGREPQGRIVLSLNGRTTDAVRNRSGYYLFLNLPSANPDGSVAGYDLGVNSEFYSPSLLEDLRPADLPLLAPVVSMTMVPNPSYPFPPGATLLRGTVQDLSGNPIPEATVEIRNSTVQGATTAKGEFALYFKRVTADDVVITAGKRLLVVNGTTNLRVRFQHPLYRSSTVVMSMEEGRTNLMVAGPVRLRPKP